MSRKQYRTKRVMLLLTLFFASGVRHLLAAASMPGAKQAIQPAGEALTNPAAVGSFFDNFFAQEMARWHVPGSAFVLVKDGKVIFSKGYGYANVEKQTPVMPDETVFRVGSVSKALTATAALQLVEGSKLDLHANVNRYLTNFKVRNPYRRPVTLAELLTHSAGLDASVIGIAERSPSQVIPLGPFLARKMPPVMMPPGKVYSYSSFGVALEGYLIQKLSAESFDAYIQKHILQPLDMRKSSFRLTPELAAHLATGYEYHRGRYSPQPIDYFNIFPAVGLYSTATDMAHFLIAQMEDGEYHGTRILSAKSVREMHLRQFTEDPRLAGRTFGFYERFVNGRRAIGHGGNIRGFASLLMLVPKDHVGFFLVFNRDESRFEEDFIQSFFDRFLPISAGAVSEAPVHLSSVTLRKFTGSYRSNPYSRRTFEKLITLYWQFRITANPDGSLEFHYPHHFKPSERWTPLAPKYFVSSGGQGHAVFDLDGAGNVAHLFTDRDSYEKVPWYGTAAFQVFLVKALMLILLSGAVCWPLQALFRRWRKKPFGGNGALRWGRPCAVALGLLNVFFILEMLHLLARMDDWDFVYGVPPAIKALLWIPIATTLLGAAVAWFAARAWQKRSWSLWGRLHYSLVAAAALSFIWFFAYWNLLGFHY